MTLSAKDILEKLIAFESVTPDQSGAQAYIAELIVPYGFETIHLDHKDVKNIFCTFDSGTPGPHLAFAGHTDVVPTGDEDAWSTPPFVPTLKNDCLYGRGAVDMKGGLAAFLAAGCNMARTLTSGKISFLITGDEEGEGKFGTLKILEYIREHDIKIDECIIAEPTSDKVFGDTIKIGRRGSLHGVLTIFGQQGHAAYPENAINPHIMLIKVLDLLQHAHFDDGFAIFPPSNLEIININTDNPTSNVIPARTKAQFNIRFNPNYTAKSLEAKLHEMINAVTQDYKLDISCNAEAFLSKRGKMPSLLQSSIKQACGITADVNASGGTSDARFIQTLCPVVEFGPLNATAHHIDEHIALADLMQLQEIFERLIQASEHMRF